MNPVNGSPRRGLGLIACLCASVAVAGCQSGTSRTALAEVAPLDESPIFAESEYGVPASPRVTNLKRVPKGGGREQVGKPYKVRGKWYYPKEEPGYVASGKASWYGSNFHGRLTANGEVYDMYHLSAAHPTFPLPSYARVTNKSNGHSVMVRVNDRGPYAHGRVVDLSQRAAEVLDFRHAGVADVKVEYVGRAPLEGDDGPMLMATYRPGSARSIDDGLPSGVMIASNEVAPQRTLSSFLGRTPLPGVRNPVARAPEPIAPAPVAAPALMDMPPLPTPRITALSYAPVHPLSGSAGALQSLLKPAAARNIHVGILEDASTFVAVAEIASAAGSLREERLAEGQVALSIELSDATASDGVLRDLWASGAQDSFLVRD